MKWEPRCGQVSRFALRSGCGSSWKEKGRYSLTDPLDCWPLREEGMGEGEDGWNQSRPGGRGKGLVQGRSPQRGEKKVDLTIWDWQSQWRSRVCGWVGGWGEQRRYSKRVLQLLAGEVCRCGQV